MRTYAEMLEAGDWPPSSRETIRMLIGGIVGLVIGLALGLAIGGV